MLSDASHDLNIGNPGDTLDSHLESKFQQKNTSPGLSGNLCGLSDIDMQTEIPNTANITEDSSYVKVKEEKGIGHNESNIHETAAFMKEVDCATRTHLDSSALGSISQNTKGTPAVKMPSAGSRGNADANFPTLASFLANPVLTSTFRLVYAPKPKTDTPSTTARPQKSDIINTSSSTGTVGYETIKLGNRCEVCETIFANETLFENHVLEGKCQWVCKLCKKVYDYSKYKTSVNGHRYSIFKSRLDQHKKECDHSCKLCGQAFLEKNKLVRHMKFRHSSAKQYKCDICFVTLKSETSLFTHKINKHSEESGIYRCPHCPNEYQMIQSLSAHLKFSHLGHKKVERPCSVCGKMYDIHRLKHHENTHKAKKIKCDRCPAVFNSESYLKRHKKRHDKDYSLYCEQCGKGFYGSKALQDHRRIHTGEKPYACTICSYRCNVNVNLDKHMKIHEKQSRQSQK